MARAATGAWPAVFKAIRNGGCHSRTELTRQLTYLTTRSSTVFDALGQYDGQSVQSPRQIEEMAERFESTWDPARRTKLGHTRTCSCPSPSAGAMVGGCTASGVEGVPELHPRDLMMGCAKRRGDLLA